MSDKVIASMERRLSSLETEVKGLRKKVKKLEEDGKSRDKRERKFLDRLGQMLRQLRPVLDFKF